MSCCRTIRPRTRFVRVPAAAGHHRVAGRAPRRPGSRRRRVRRGRAALRHRPHPRRRQDRLAPGPQRPGHPRLPRRRRASPALCAPRASAATTRSSSTATSSTGGLRTPSGSSSSSATRTCGCSTAAGRSGSPRGGALTREVPQPAAAPTTRCRCATTRRSAPSATTCWRTSPAGGRWSTSARPKEYTGEMLHMADYPQEGALRGGHIPGAVSMPWKSRGERGRHVQVGRRAAGDLRGRARARAGRRRDRLLPDRRAVQPHLVRAALPARLPARSATTTARGPSGATWSGHLSSRVTSPARTRADH